MEEKNKGGRPSKKDEEKRTERAVCRITKNEKKRLLELAKKRGISESELIRDLIFSPVPYSSENLKHLSMFFLEIQETMSLYDNNMPQALSIKLLKTLREISTIINQN